MHGRGGFLVGSLGVTAINIRGTNCFGGGPASSGLRRLEREPLEIRLTEMVSTLSTLGRRELPVGVNLFLELQKQCISRGCCTGGSVLGPSPGLMSGNLAAQRQFNGRCQLLTSEVIRLVPGRQRSWRGSALLRDTEPAREHHVNT